MDTRSLLGETTKGEELEGRPHPPEVAPCSQC